MATKLFLRNTTTNGIVGGPIYYDMLTTAGAAAVTAVTDTVAIGDAIQLTLTSGGSLIQWVSGRAPAGGFTLTTGDYSVWMHESNMAANCGAQVEVARRTKAGVETNHGGFPDGIEFGTSAAEFTQTTNVNPDVVFAENDRILLKVLLGQIGAMGGPYTCTITFNGPNAATGDSFFNIFETVTFKEEDVPPTRKPVAGHSFAVARASRY